MKATAEFLEGLDWRNPRACHALVADHWSSLQPTQVLADLGENLLDAVDLDRSVEKTTHYKWFLGEWRSRDFELWLHEYKPSNLRRPGHATVPHNHRFWLTSLILRGGFCDTRYARAETEALIEPLAGQTLRPGGTMVIDPQEIHSISELRDGTLSLLLQSRPVRSYSEVFEDGEVRRYFDLEAKLAELRESL